MACIVQKSREAAVSGQQLTCHLTKVWCPLQHAPHPSFSTCSASTASSQLSLPPDPRESNKTSLSAKDLASESASPAIAWQPPPAEVSNVPRASATSCAASSVPCGTSFFFPSSSRVQRVASRAAWACVGVFLQLCVCFSFFASSTVCKASALRLPRSLVWVLLFWQQTA
eukprot:2332063-Amphidinium_carterae.3